MTADTLREVEGFVEVRSLGALQVKGFSTAIDAFELTGATTARNRLQAAEARGLSPFVGRLTEIAFARQMLAQTAAGHGRVLAVVGEAGMGKSRLLRQFLDHHVSSEWRVVEAPSVSYGKATPYFPVIELLRGFFNLHESDDADAVRSRVAEELLTLATCILSWIRVHHIDDQRSGLWRFIARAQDRLACADCVGGN